MATATVPTYDLEIKQGDYFRVQFTIPDLSSLGGPATLDAAGVSVAAQIRATARSASSVDLPLTRVGQVLTLELLPARTQTMSAGVWDLQVSKHVAFPDEEVWAKTLLGGTVRVTGDVTRG